MAKVKCKDCGTTIESKYRHDFVVCECWDPENGRGIAIDGGDDYCRVIGDPKKMEWMTFEPEKEH